MPHTHTQTHHTQTTHMTHTQTTHTKDNRCKTYSTHQKHITSTIHTIPIHNTHTTLDSPMPHLHASNTYHTHTTYTTHKYYTYKTQYAHAYCKHNHIHDTYTSPTTKIRQMPFTQTPHILQTHPTFTTTYTRHTPTHHRHNTPILQAQRQPKSTAHIPHKHAPNTHHAHHKTFLNPHLHHFHSIQPQIYTAFHHKYILHTSQNTQTPHKDCIYTTHCT